MIAGGAWSLEALAADAPGGAPGGRDNGQFQQRIDQFRQQMSDRMKQALGASDEEWKILQPRIEKVQTLSRQTRGGGMGSMLSGRRGGGPGGGDNKREGDKAQSDRPQSDRPQSEVEKKVESLQKVLENKDAKPEEIKASLASLREARAKARLDLEAAQKELREIVTLRQEGQLVSMGLLE
jgi:DNA repair exonuclease SbcCD ATPase subunit